MSHSRSLAADSRTGFTLIELSIVLVIIGLIVGGVLVGQDLIRAATLRAQITQIEKFNTATNTFYGKYQALPGDLNITTAQAYGFATANRSNCPGLGDGNGLLEANMSGTCTYNGLDGSGQAGEATGENAMFWVELTSANGLNLNLIDGSFNTSHMWCCINFPIMVTTTPGIKDILPAAKIGGGAYVYTASAYGANYYGITTVWYINGNTSGISPFGSSPAFTAKQAYDIDRKMDDGLPLSGNVTAQAICCPSPTFVSDEYTPPIPYAATAALYANSADQSATAPGAGTCYDNGGNAGPQHYSTSFNRGNGLNCSLLFKFQ